MKCNVQMISTTLICEMNVSCYDERIDNSFSFEWVSYYVDTHNNGEFD